MATTYTTNIELPKHDTADPFDITLINNAMDILDNEFGIQKTGLSKRDRVYNLLDNSDFRNPVNQRGGTSYGGTVYSIDRWKLSPGDLSVNDGYISISRGSRSYSIFAQFTPNVKEGITYTLAAQTAEGEIATLKIVFSVDMSPLAKNFSTAGHSIIARYSTSSKMFYVGLSSTIDTPLNVVWMALYEGEYTVDNLPTYVPKGYAAELLECQMYYHLYATQAARPTHGLDCSPPMRIAAPAQGTIIIDGTTYYYNDADL